MRKYISVLLAVAGLTLIPAAAFSQPTDWNGRYRSKDLIFEIGAGFGAHGEGFGYGVAAAPGVEWIVADRKVGQLVPLAAGVAAKALAEYIPGTGLGVGADALWMLHLGFDGLEAAEFVQNLDVYAAVGGGVVYVGEADSPIGLIFPTICGGVAWFFRDSIALYLEGVFRNGWQSVGYGGAVFGIRFKRTPA